MEDIFLSYIAGMDTFALGLKAAAKLIEDGRLDKFVDDRYASWTGGVKEADFVLNGRGAYSRMKYESGVHRVQRVPETESGGRVHTSTATVAVLPEMEAVDVSLNPADIEMQVYRASGAGGQHVNKTSSAVRLILKQYGGVLCYFRHYFVEPVFKMAVDIVERLVENENRRFGRDRKSVV